jgi:isoleucyl-tRNA synthetase
MYRSVQKDLDIPEIQEKILSYWDDNKIFEKSLELNKGREITFYDGPPFPTGQPHHGTVLVSFIKDFIARYLTMRGYNVPRRWGWDCHGLPIETQAEESLRIKDKTEIETVIGVEKFNSVCRSIVNSNNESWRTYIRAMARWVDYENSYKTMDFKFMESVIWVFKKCYEKGLIYEDFRVTPYCYRCETSLSISDTRESDSTRLRQDPSIIVRFKANVKNVQERIYFLAWTTTPWTLPSNLALAVSDDIEYAYVEYNDGIYILAKDTISRVGFDKYKIQKTVKGNELVGMTYEPLFPYFEEKAKDNCFRIISADFVEVTEGVGIVHIAPAFGEDDYWVCKKEGITLVNPVDEKGCFTSEVPDFKGKNVLEANREIIAHLKRENKLVDHRTYEHNYPHCWRCRNPLIYKAMKAWYFSIEKIKEQLVEKNQNINWVPDLVKNGRFGIWLKNARDWNISRNRYWSTPIPVWKCNKCQKTKVFGNVEEIQTAGKAKISDLHKEILDKITFPCECGGTYQRVPEVLDCWFETGSMPYAQNHYPFENVEWFDKHFPADFIVEYTGQIRCWFYYLHVLAVALFQKPAFKNCVVHGTILSSDGKKISKSKKNYTDPLLLMKTYGTDAFRLYLFKSNVIVMGDLNFVDDGVLKAFLQIIVPLWNAFYFFTTYANIDNVYIKEPVTPQSTNVIDKWILSKLYQTCQEVTQYTDKYQIDRYLQPLIVFLDDLTNFYIRRSRNRFWVSKESENKDNVYTTLYFVLVNFCKLLAPCAPIITEEIFLNLTNGKSIHLSTWPDISDEFYDENLIRKFDIIKKIIYLGRSIRVKNNLKNRQPLSEMKILLPAGIDQFMIEDEAHIIKEELNIKNIIFTKDISELANIKYQLNFKLLGPKLGNEIKILKEAIDNLPAHHNLLRNNENMMVVKYKDKEWALNNDELSALYESKEALSVESYDSIVVGLNVKLTRELIEEGIARDLVRHIQEMRKEMGLEVMDRIKLIVEGDLPIKWKKYISEQTLSEFTNVMKEGAKKEININNGVYLIRISRNE